MKRFLIFVSAHLFLFLLVVAYQAQAETSDGTQEAYKGGKGKPSGQSGCSEYGSKYHRSDWCRTIQNSDPPKNVRFVNTSP